jgi:hypothetical protein
VAERQRVAAARDGSLSRAATAILEQLQYIRACAKVDECTLEFVDPARPGLYDALGDFHRILEALPRLESPLRNSVVEYYEGLRQLADLPCDDAAYWTAAGRVALLLGNLPAAENHFLGAFAAPLRQVGGPAPSDRLTGAMLAGLVETARRRMAAAQDPAVHRPGLLDVSGLDVDLLRLHLVSQVVPLVPGPVRASWALSRVDEDAIAAAGGRAREILAGRGVDGI